MDSPGVITEQVSLRGIMHQGARGLGGFRLCVDPDEGYTRSLKFVLEMSFNIYVIYTSDKSASAIPCETCFRLVPSG